MPDWKKNGGMELAEVDGLRQAIQDEAAYVLVDLRSKKAAKKGHIPTAVGIPAKKLAKAKAKFPKNKKAQIYLYDKGVNVDAFLMVKGWGYKKVSVLNGGFKGWTGKVMKGKPASKIVYVKKTPKGQISIADFKAAIGSKDKFILDVRDFSDGVLKGAIHIPNGDVADNLSKLPKDKEILVHCNTGVLARSTAKMLKEKGFKVRYLNAVVQVSEDGSYEINEK